MFLLLKMLSLSSVGKPTRGSSEAACFVAEKIEEGRRRFQDSYSLGLPGVFDELYATAEQCSIPNWDGYGAAAVTKETCLNAYRFLETLPLGTQPPTVGAEPDGSLTLEWYQSPRWTLSLSLNSEADIHYAALLGTSRQFGTLPFLGDVPEPILRLIEQVASI